MVDIWATELGSAPTVINMAISKNKRRINDNGDCHSTENDMQSMYMG